MKSVSPNKKYQNSRNCYPSFLEDGFFVDFWKYFFVIDRVKLYSSANSAIEAPNN